MHTNRKAGYAVAVGLAAVVLVSGVIALVDRSSPTPTASADPAFSAYVGVASPSRLTALGKALGHRMAFGTDCFDDRSWSGIDDDLWLIQHWKGTGYPMVFCVPMLPEGPQTTLAEGATGAYNEHFVALARMLIAHGMARSNLRLGWEFNNANFPWYAAGQADDFIAYWRQIVGAMRSVPGAHFTFVWNPSRSSPGPATTAVGNLDDYYPGNAFVDKMGIDVYDQDFADYPGANAEFEKLETLPGGLDWIAGFGATHRKPVTVPEFGLGAGPSAPGGGAISRAGPVSGGDNPAFVNDMFAWARARHVANIAYWDYGTSSIDNGQNPLTAAALRQQITPS